VKLEAILASLDEVPDDGLHTIETRCQELQVLHDKERKDKALEQARTILTAAGLSLQDVAAGKMHKNGGKAPSYRSGMQYQHPNNKALVWNARGQKPHWLRDLESEGRKPMELLPEPANDNIPPSLKKTG
jgi:DNA-binding protein H-NS